MQTQKLNGKMRRLRVGQKVQLTKEAKKVLDWRNGDMSLFKPKTFIVSTIVPVTETVKAANPGIQWVTLNPPIRVHNQDVVFCQRWLEPVEAS